MVAVTADAIQRVVQDELDREPAKDYRLIANLFVRRKDGSWVVRVEPDRDGVSSTDLANRLVAAEERLVGRTEARVDLLPVVIDELGLLGAEIVKTGEGRGL